MRRLLLALPLLAAAPVAAQTLPADQAAIKAHVAFLASDALRGREAGTADYDVAAEYMATQMLAAGLVPAGGQGSWFQPVPLISYKSAGPGTLALVRGGTRVPLVYGKDFLNSVNPRVPDLAIGGEVLFAGYGVVDAASGRDDYKGLDLKGRIVALFAGAPTGLSSEVAAHAGNLETKAGFAAARGAKGLIVLESGAQRASFPFERAVPLAGRTRMTINDADGKPRVPSIGAPQIALVSQAGAEKLFADSSVKWADVLAAEKAGTPLPTGPLNASVEAAFKTEISVSASRNVVGMLEGSDPALRRQYVVLSAHLDHLAVGAGTTGDRISNGAMDNAIGNATILQVARAFQASGTKPRRSILFVSLTAEEKGLLGSRYFARTPSVPGTLVANINLDMPIMTFPLVDIVVLGGERSILGKVAEKAAAAEGLKVVPDPFPEENFFVRSDHYSFVQAGVPAVSIDTGPGGAGKAAIQDFLAKHYHKPSDDLSLPFDWASAAKFVRVGYGVARILADTPARPTWNKGDFFGTLYGGPLAK
ncbi:M28 family metallopeptidase [Sphingomonas sp. M1-B02]|uniref:M28 family metallopeptidase n=1 Tax=Sphingomonas sp. M1-B02 TaxID=3114300 RepID=UPI002240C1B9|nr:M28 family metallopeptidase [Sphingomonas sp. S6-11]UZK64897.1 M28 family metallopeptidase [Sphingomonas sp. S6-11]